MMPLDPTLAPDWAVNIPPPPAPTAGDAGELDLASYLIFIAVAAGLDYAIETIKRIGKQIPDDEPGLKGLVGKICRAVVLYIPNRTTGKGAKKDDGSSD